MFGASRVQVAQKIPCSSRVSSTRWAITSVILNPMTEIKLATLWRRIVWYHTSGVVCDKSTFAPLAWLVAWFHTERSSFVKMLEVDTFSVAMSPIFEKDKLKATKLLAKDESRVERKTITIQSYFLRIANAVPLFIQVSL